MANRRKSECLTKYKQCTSLPVSSLVKLLKEKRLGDAACVLCLCEDSLMSFEESVLFNKEDVGSTVSLQTFIKKLPISLPDCMSETNKGSEKKICLVCVDQISKFYLFAMNCQKARTAIRNLNNIVSINENKKTNQSQNMPSKENICDYVTCFQLDKIVQADHDIFKLVALKNFAKEDEDVTVICKKEEPLLNCDICSMTCMDVAKLVQHKKNHQYNNVINYISHYTPLCIFCLKNGENIISVSDQISSEILNDQGIPVICKVAPALLIKEGLNILVELTTEKAQICESCSYNVVKIYNFRKMLQRSITNFKLIVKIFDENLMSTISQCKHDNNCAKIYIDMNKMAEQKEKQCKFEDNLDSDYGFKEYDDNTVNTSMHILKPLYCEYCNKSCSCKDAMKRHMRKHRKSAIVPVCEICGDIFSTKDQVASHKVLVHKDYNKCDYCKHMLKFGLKFNRHIKKCEFTIKPYTCDLCYALCETRLSLKHHRRRHFPRLRCQLCCKNFWKGFQLTSHFKKMHNAVTLSKRVYPCAKCTIDFTTKSDLTNHFNSHSVDDEYTCRVCNESFEVLNNFKKHCKIAHNFTQTTAGRNCPVCGGTFSSDYKFTRHMKTHSPGKLQDLDIDLRCTSVNKTRVICDVCGKTLHNKYSLALHIEKHKARADCDVCSKYALVGDLKKHHKAHGDSSRQYYKRKNNETFSCGRCDYVSQSKAARDAHINRHHLNVRPYKCDVCGKAYYSNSTLTEHKTNTHAMIKKEMCLQCGARFSCRKSLKLHIRLHTGETPYKCDQCEQSFLSTSRLREHIQRTHRSPNTPCPICSKLFHYERSVRAHIRKVHERANVAPNKRMTKHS